MTLPKTCFYVNIPLKLKEHQSTCTVANSDYRYPSTPNPISSLSRNSGLSHSQTPEATPTMSAANLKRHINKYFNPDSLLLSISGNLTRPPPPILPFFPIAPPANTLVSLRLQLMKATVLAESYFIFSLGSTCYADVYRRESRRCCTLPFFLTYFLSFHLSRFSFYINKR